MISKIPNASPINPSLEQGLRQMLLSQGVSTEGLDDAYNALLFSETDIIGPISARREIPNASPPSMETIDALIRRHDLKPIDHPDWKPPAIGIDVTGMPDDEFLALMDSLTVIDPE